MSDILQDNSPTRLITAIEENMASFLPVFGMLGEWHTNNPAGVQRSITDIPYSLVNSIMNARLTSKQVEAAIQSIMTEAQSRQVPVLWWTGPSTRPADLGKYLEKHGFILADEAPGMAVDLAQVNENLPALEGLTIQPAEDEAAWHQWTRAMASGFEFPPSAEFVMGVWFNILRLADPATTLAYTGWLHGQPVATSLLFLAAGVAGIYSVATIPEARRKGIGAWMTLYPLLQARALGYRIGILQSSEMGLHVYRGLGFQEYCKINMYRWRPEE